MKVLQLAVRNPMKVSVEGREYSIEFPVKAVATLEEKLGRSMKFAADWLKIRTKEVEDVLAVGLSRNHHEDAAEVAARICDTLETEAIEEVIEGLCWSVFPRAMERIEAAAKRIREGHTSPNAPSADAR